MQRFWLPINGHAAIRLNRDKPSGVLDQARLKPPRAHRHCLLPALYEPRQKAHDRAIYGKKNMLGASIFTL